MSIQINKKWMPLIIGLVLILLIGGVSVTTGQSGPTLITGNDVCSGTQGALFCRKTVTFPAFASPPKILANAQSCSGGACSHNTAFGGFRESLFVDENTSWINMPSTQADLFSDTTGSYVQIVDFGKIGGYRLEVTCPRASNTAGAFIAPQWSSDGGITWRFLGTTQTGAGSGDVIDGFGNAFGVQPNRQCGAGSYNNTIFNNVEATPFQFQAIDTSLLFSNPNLNNIMIRIVGGGGGGIGDIPFISRVSVEFQITGIINDNRDVLSTSFVCYGLAAGETVSSVTIECDIIGFILVTTFTIPFNWQATA